MDYSFALQSQRGHFDVTPDQDCMMVYVKKHRDRALPLISPSEMPSWCFNPETIWFYFEAPEPEDKVSAGEKIKSTFLKELDHN